MSEPSKELSGLLARWADGETAARDELFAVVYAELRRLAGGYMRRERADHTLQPTALVHEAFFRLTNGVPVSWADRSHFFRVAARAMRHILVDHGRGVSAAKRGSGQKNQLLDEEIVIPGIDVEILALDKALTQLGTFDERLLQVVELRYFTGLRVEEVGELLGVSSRTVKRDWRSARAWLLAELGPTAEPTQADVLGGR